MIFVSAVTAAELPDPKSPDYNKKAAELSRASETTKKPVLHHSFKFSETTKKVTSADIVFIIDYTGSMSEEIQGVKDNLSAFAEDLQKAGIDARYAVIAFEDITHDGLDSTIVYKFSGDIWTSDVTALKNTLDSITVDDGGDWEETPTDAIAKIFSSGFWFRAGATHYAFILTDAPAKDYTDDSRIMGIERAANLLMIQSIHTSVVSIPSLEEHYRPIYGPTGGRFIDIYSDYVAIMAEVAGWVTEISTSTIEIDALERGRTGTYSRAGNTDSGIICGWNSQYYLDSEKNIVTEDTISALDSATYRKDGLTADGNTRLILRVRSLEESGDMTFSVSPDIGASLEILENDGRRTALSSPSTTATSTYATDKGYQVSVILTAPKNYPDKLVSNIASGTGYMDFTFSVKFTNNSGDVTSKDLPLKLYAVPVVMIHGRASNFENTFRKDKDHGVYKKLTDGGLDADGPSYVGTMGPSWLISENEDEYKTSEVYEHIAKRLDEWNNARSIACSKVDVVAHSMGGLMTRQLLKAEAAFNSDKDYEPYDNSVIRRVVTIATPHRGSAMALFALNPVIGSLAGEEVNYLDVLAEIFGNAKKEALDEAVRLEKKWLGLSFLRRTASFNFYKDRISVILGAAATSAQIERIAKSLSEGSRIPSDLLSLFEGKAGKLPENEVEAADTVTRFLRSDIVDLIPCSRFLQGLPEVNEIDTPMYSIYGTLGVINWIDELGDAMIDEGIDGFKTHLSELLNFDELVMSVIKASLLHIADVKSVVSLTELSLGALLNAVSGSLELAFWGGIDEAVTANSATSGGNFGKYSERIGEGWQYRHTSICQQDDVGDRVVALLTGSESAFLNGEGSDAVTLSSTSLKSSSAFSASSVNFIASENSDSASTTETKFTMTEDDSDPIVVSTSGTSTKKFSVNAGSPMSYDMYLNIKDGGSYRLVRIPSAGKTSFDISLEFDSSNAGMMDISTFAKGDDDNTLYVSNVVPIVVRPNSADVTGISFAGNEGYSYTKSIVSDDGTLRFVETFVPGVIKARVGSGICAGLYATLNDGSLTDISAEAMGTSWDVEDSSILEITDRGLIMGLSEGSTTITASNSGYTASVSVDVAPAYTVPADPSSEDNNEDEGGNTNEGSNGSGSSSQNQETGANTEDNTPSNQPDDSETIPPAVGSASSGCNASLGMFAILLFAAFTFRKNVKK